MFNDNSNEVIGVPDMTLAVEDPRRAFLIVDNNTDSLMDAETNEDGTIYGEAIVVEHKTGAAWGYIAYNAVGGVKVTDTDLNLNFSDADHRDQQGEVIWVMAPPADKQWTCSDLAVDRDGNTYVSGMAANNVHGGYRMGPIFGGMLMALLTLMKSQPLAYNKDNQEDKEPLFDAVDNVKGSLKVFADMVPAITCNPPAMREAALKGFATATDLADYLVLKDVPFREAHGIVGRIVGHCIDKGCELVDLTVQEMQGFSPVIEKDVYEVISVDGSVQSRISTGGTSLQRVEEALGSAEKQVGIA